MSRTIDFEVGTDTGEADADAIQPTLDGEKVFGPIIQRPDDNLRLRTEVLRAEANAQRWVRDADQAVTYFLTTGDLTWGGVYSGGVPTPPEGELVLSASASLVVAPMYGPGETRTTTTTGGNSVEGGGTLWPARFAFAELDDGDYATHGIDVISLKYDFEGGNDISITITDVPGSGGINVFVAGDGTVADPATQPGQDDIQVTYDSVLVHTIQDVVDAINADSVANQLVDAFVAGSIPTTAMYDVATTSLNDGIDGVHHIITDVNLAAFFAISTDNLLREGDILAIHYETPRLRRRSIEETAEETIPAASLVNLTAEPDKAPNCVVIGRVIEDEFVLTNGVRMPDGVSISSLSVASDGIIRADYERPIASPPAAGVDEGSKRLGVDASPFTVLSTLSESQQEVNEDIDTQFAALDVAVPKQYVSVSSLIGSLPTAGFGIVAHSDAGFPWDEIAGTDTGADVLDLDGDGEYVVEISEGGSVASLRNKTTHAVIQTYTPSNALGAGLQAVAMNGEFVALAYGAYIELFNRNTGASVWDYDTLTTPTDLAMDGVRVYYCAVGAAAVRALNISGGGSAWTFSHGVTLQSIETDGSRVYLAGDPATGSGTTATDTAVFALRATTGALLWENDLGATTWVDLQHALATDGLELFVVDRDGDVHRLMADNGTTEETLTTAAVSVSVDRDFIYIGLTFAVDVVPRRYGLGGLDNAFRVGPVLQNRCVTYSDGETLFIGEDQNPSDSDHSLKSIRRQNRDRLWRRVIAGTLPSAHWPFQQLAFPTD